jgi:hypothetical protein
LVTAASGINNSNDVVGYYFSGGGYHGYLDKSGVYSPVNYPGAGATSTVVYGTSNSDQVVGYYTDTTGTHGFTEQGGAYTAVNFPGAVATYVMGINSDGSEIVGSYSDGVGLHAFVDDGGVFTTVDFPGAPITYAAGVNNAGDIVGWYEPCSGCVQVGFVRDTTGAYSSLTPMPGIPTYFTGINDSNQVMVAVLGASYTTEFGTEFGYLLTGWSPNNPPPPPPPIPEPGTQLLMATGGILLLALGRLRRRS